MQMDSMSVSQTTTSLDSNSKSGESSKNTFIERDEDFTKDNAASPIDLECQIQDERINKIIDDALYKTKIACAFNILVFDHYHEIKKILTEQNMDELLFIFEQYDSMYTHSLINLGALADIREGDISLKRRLNPELGHVIYMLNSRKELKPIVEAIVQQMQHECHQETEESATFKSYVRYLTTFEQFKDVMVRRLQASAADVLSAKLETRKLDNSNKEYLEKIKDMSETLQAEEAIFNRTVKEKSQIIYELEQELNFLDNIAKTRLTKQVVDTDREMIMAFRAHQVKNQMLKEVEVDTRLHYNELLRRSLIEEKNQRARRLKVETQLLSWIQKYDNEMTEKQKELDDFIEKYKSECEKVDKLEKELAEQNKEYIPLMAEREEEYNQEMTAKLEAFIVEHAAKVIQNAWKQVLKNRAEKKKLKKAVQKMKEAAEKAALKAEQEAKKAEKEAKKAAKLAAQEAKAAEKERKAQEAAEKAAAKAQNKE